MADQQKMDSNTKKAMIWQAIANEFPDMMPTSKPSPSLAQREGILPSLPSSSKGSRTGDSSKSAGRCSTRTSSCSSSFSSARGSTVPSTQGSRRGSTRPFGPAVLPALTGVAWQDPEEITPTRAGNTQSRPPSAADRCQFRLSDDDDGTSDDELQRTLEEAVLAGCDTIPDDDAPRGSDSILDSNPPVGERPDDSGRKRATSVRAPSAARPSGAHRRCPPSMGEDAATVTKAHLPAEMQQTLAHRLPLPPLAVHAPAVSTSAGTGGRPAAASEQAPPTREAWTTLQQPKTAPPKKRHVRQIHRSHFASLNSELDDSTVSVEPEDHTTPSCAARTLMKL